MEIIPQLDVTTYSSQLFWLFISFVILYLILRNLIVPKIESIIKDRSSFVHSQISASSKAIQLAESEVIKNNTTLANAKRNSLHTIEGILQEVKLMKETSAHVISNELIEISKLSNKKINHMKQDSRNEMINLSVEIALLYYKKLFNSDCNEKDKLFYIAQSLYNKKL